MKESIHKGEKEEGLTLKREVMWRERAEGGAEYKKAMNEVRLMKGLSVLQFLTLMAPEASPQEGYIP